MIGIVHDVLVGYDISIGGDDRTRSDLLVDFGRSGGWLSGIDQPTHVDAYDGRSDRLHQTADAGGRRLMCKACLRDGAKDCAKTSQ